MITYFDRITFAHPWVFILLVIIPLLSFWYFKRHNKTTAPIAFSGFGNLQGVPSSWRVKWRHSLFVLRMVVIALLITALARPQSSTSRQDVTVEGIDIVMALDISSSMLAEDFSPNRLEAAKAVADEFIKGRPGDRIGLVVFAGEAFTQCPLTTDHTVLHDLFGKIKSGMIEDGTAIGDGMATAVNRLQESLAVSKVIILLTDGENNRGNIDPLMAAEIAKTYGLRIYTIGVGTEGMAPYPVKTPFGTQYQNVEVKIDEKLLATMADATGGKYFRATDNQSLKAIYGEIDQMEKSRIDVTEFRKKHEEFLPFALFATFILLAEFALRQFVFRSL